MKKLWIRPVYNESDQLLGLCLCRTEQTVLVDEQVVEHFELDITGKEIKETAVEFGWVDSVEDVSWSTAIVVKN